MSAAHAQPSGGPRQHRGGKFPSSARGQHPFALTDYGNAERIAAWFSDAIRYVPGRSWFAWDGRRWRPDADGEAMRCAKAMARRIFLEAANPEIAAEEREALAKHAIRSEAEPKLRAALKLAQSERSLIVAPDQLDADPYLLNVLNGTVDLRTGELRPHDRADRISKLAPVTYKPGARHAVFDAFIERTTHSDQELAGYVQRVFGYATTGDPCEERLFFVHGPTASGKSTLLEAVKATLGDYASTADFSAFLKSRRDSTIRNDIARLAGVRLVVSIEVDEGKELAEGVVKAVTGGDTVTARYLYKEFFEFVPAFTLVLAANRRPHVSAADAAMWRRISVVPFTETVPEAERDPAVKRTLRNDPDARTAILAWLMQGCLDWQRNGLQEPEIVRAYTAEYRAENDLLRDWIEDQVRLDPGGFTPSSKLLRSYERWAQENGREPLTANQLAATLREHGFQPSRVHGGQRGWRGLKLTSGGDTG